MSNFCLNPTINMILQYYIFEPAMLLLNFVVGYCRFFISTFFLVVEYTWRLLNLFVKKYIF